MVLIRKSDVSHRSKAIKGIEKALEQGKGKYIGYKNPMMAYDLRWLSRKGIICRIPQTNRYFLTSYGWKVCRFFSRLNARVFGPTFMSIISSDISSYQQSLQETLDRVDREINKIIDTAGYLKKAAR